MLRITSCCAYQFPQPRRRDRPQARLPAAAEVEESHKLDFRRHRRPRNPRARLPPPSEVEESPRPDFGPPWRPRNPASSTSDHGGDREIRRARLPTASEVEKSGELDFRRRRRSRNRGSSTSDRRGSRGSCRRLFRPPSEARIPWISFSDRRRKPGHDHVRADVRLWSGSSPRVGDPHGVTKTSMKRLFRQKPKPGTSKGTSPWIHSLKI